MARQKKYSLKQQIDDAFGFSEASQRQSDRGPESYFPSVYASDTISPASLLPAGGSSSAGGADALTAILKTASDAVTENTKNLTAMQSAQQQLLAATGQNTTALLSNTATKSTSSSSTSATASSLMGIFDGGSILAPLITGLLGLFGPSTTTTGPTPYIAPPPLNVGSQIGSNPTGTQGPGAILTPAPASSTAAAAAPAPVTNHFNLTVQALDSQSIVDHSNEIADAVQKALLNSHSLNDTISQI